MVYQPHRTPARHRGKACRHGSEKAAIMSALDIEKLRPQLETFLQGVVRTGRFRLRFQIQTAEPLADGQSPELLVQLDGEDADLLLARGGEMLAALEHIAAKVLRLSSEEQHLLSFDCHDYKSLHEDELRLMASTAAERVQRTGQPFALSPMNPRERRLVHLALKDHTRVRTESDGAGPHRHVVILPRKQS